jgi:DNA repair protein RadC
MNIPLKNKQKIRLHNALDIYHVMRDILLLEDENDRSKEHFWTISLDNGNTVLNIELVSLGTATTTLVEPMEVFSIPLQKKAVRLILVHNHPSGNIVPSYEDEDTTDRLIQVGLIMNVPILDHIIITENSYYSFEESGLLAKLAKSTKYVPAFILKERYEKLAKEERAKAELKGMKDNQKEIVLRMRSEGCDVETIMRFTGLTKAQINRIQE